MTNALSNDEVKKLLKAWRRARTIGLPLTIFVTVRPANILSMDTAARCAEFKRIRNLYDQFARRHRFKPAYLYARERAQHFDNEHFHLLCHVPKRLKQEFVALAETWRLGAGEIDIRPACYREHWTPSGKIKSAGHYVVKQMSPQAAWKRPYIRQRGGPITGKRWGCSLNLRTPADASGHCETHGGGFAPARAMLQSAR